MPGWAGAGEESGMAHRRERMTMTDAPRAAAFTPDQAAELGTGTERPGWNLDVERRIDDGRTLANAIGWFSIGLGAAEVLAPRRLSRWLGMENGTRLIQAYGVREISKGVGILANRRPEGWLWARVAGDALDLATLATGLRPDNPRRRNVAIAIGAVAGVALLDVLCARQLGQHHVH
jgi:hypothetical protein